MKAAAQALAIGKAEVVQDGDDVAIFGLGAMLPMAKELAAMLEQRGIFGGGDQSAVCQADRPRADRG